MVERPAWRVRLEEASQRRPIVWLSGVRRVGKTTLARMLSDIDYLNCDLPSVQRALADPELFLGGVGTEAVLVFDDPSPCGSEWSAQDRRRRASRIAGAGDGFLDLGRYREVPGLAHGQEA